MPTHRALEHDLLLCCARTEVDGATALRIGELLQQAIDWRYLLETAIRHQLVALLAHNLCGEFADRCPPEMVSELRALLKTNAARNLMMGEALLELLDLLDRHGIPAIPFKGPLLASAVYGNLALRCFADLDLMVHPWDYHFSVPQLLYQEGWELVDDFGFERTFRDRGKMRIDIHQSFTPQRHIPLPLRFNALWKRAVDVPLLGKTVKGFAAEDLLIILCVQLAKDIAEQGSAAPALIKICDLAELVRREPDLDWRAALDHAAGMGAERMVCLGLQSAQHLLGLPLAREVVRRSAVIPQLPDLLTHVEEAVLRHDRGLSRPELGRQARWHEAVRERLRDRHRVLRAALYYLSEPNAKDYGFVRLPRAMHALYYLVRPLRLLYRYGGMLVGKRVR
jgi:hypothetical protein